MNEPESISMMDESLSFELGSIFPRVPISGSKKGHVYNVKLGGFLSFTGEICQHRDCGPAPLNINKLRHLNRIPVPY